MRSDFSLKNAHIIDGGDYDAAIAAAAAAVTYVQRLGQEVGSGDEGLGLFSFDFHQQERTFGDWRTSSRRKRSQSCPGVLTPAQNTCHRPGESGCLSWRV